MIEYDIDVSAEELEAAKARCELSGIMTAEAAAARAAAEHALEQAMFDSIERERAELAKLAVEEAANEERRRAFFARLKLREDNDPPMKAAEVAIIREEFEKLQAEWERLIERRRALSSSLIPIGNLGAPGR